MSYTQRNETGLMAAPDNPPFNVYQNRNHLFLHLLPRLSGVFTAVKTSAPASTAALANTTMSATLGDSLTINGTVVSAFTFLTTA